MRWACVGEARGCQSRACFLRFAFLVGSCSERLLQWVLSPCGRSWCRCDLHVVCSVDGLRSARVACANSGDGGVGGALRTT